MPGRGQRPCRARQTSSYVDGVTGGNVFVITLQGARNLAAAMMGIEPEDPTPPSSPSSSCPPSPRP